MKTRRTEYVVKRDCVSRIVTLPDGMARRTTLSLEENVELVADCDRFKLLTHSNGELEESDFEAFGAQCGKFTKTICGICHDRFIIVDQKEIFWKMRRRNACAFRRGDSAKAEPEGRTSVRGASLKDAGHLTFAAAKMGAKNLTHDYWNWSQYAIRQVAATTIKEQDGELRQRDRRLRLATEERLRRWCYGDA